MNRSTLMYSFLCVVWLHPFLRMVCPHHYTTRLSAQTARRPAGTARDSAAAAELLQGQAGVYDGGRFAAASCAVRIRPVPDRCRAQNSAEKEHAVVRLYPVSKMLRVPQAEASAPRRLRAKSEKIIDRLSLYGLQVMIVAQSAMAGHGSGTDEVFGRHSPEVPVDQA